MKKEFNALVKALPDWAKKRTIMVLADQEMLAIKIPRQEALIKKTRCVQCGECCLDVPDRQTPWGSDEEGKCNALKKDRDKWICIAGLQKPFTCLTDPLKGNAPGCSIEYF